MGTHELQTSKVQVFGSKEGEGYRQIPLQAGRIPDDVSRWETSEEPWEGL